MAALLLLVGLFSLACLRSSKYNVKSNFGRVYPTSIGNCQSCLEAGMAKRAGRSGKSKKAGKKNNGAVLGFEETLWRAADKLRHNMDAAEYKHGVPLRAAG